MSKHEDKIFMKNFSLVILVLMGIAVVCIVIARAHVAGLDEDSNPSRYALKDERTRPVAAVRTELSAADLAAATPVAASSAEPVDPASIDGQAIYMQACQACHMTGAAGAPIPGSDPWVERAAQGIETLVSHAINGLNAMPPKGGRMDLSDAEVTAAVEHMLAQ